MKVSLSCRACGHNWVVQDEPRHLVALGCPTCANVAAQAATEDFASALEDALVQLYLLGKTHAVDVTLSTETIPPSFRPLPEDLPP